MNSKAKNIIKALLFLAFGLTILFFLYQRQNAAYLEECALKGIPDEECSLLQKVWSDMVSANWFYVFLSLALFTLSNVVRALRWHIILEPLDYKPKFINSFGAVSIAYLSNLGIPRSGEFVRAGVLSRYENYDFEKVFGTIITDRIADIICLLLIIALAFFTSFPELSSFFNNHPEYFGRFQNMNIGSFLSIFIGITILVGGILHILFTRFKTHKLVAKIREKFLGLWEGVLTITKLRRPWLFVFHTIIIWLCYYLMTYVVFFAFEPTSHLGPVEGLVVFVFGSFGIIIPSPGGMGTYHYLIGEALSFYGVNSSDAFSLANILFFSVQLLCNVLYGVLALIILPIVNKK